MCSKRRARRALGCRARRWAGRLLTAVALCGVMGGVALGAALAPSGGAPASPSVRSVPPAKPAADARWEPARALREAAEEYVRRHLPAGAAAASVRVRAGEVPAHFPRCAAGRLSEQAFGNPNPYGAQTVELRCDAPQAWSVYLPVAVDWPQQVVVAAHALAPGHTLSDADLQVVQRDRTSLPPGAVQNESEATGRVLRRGVAAGQSITDDMLAGPQLVHYGQAVSLIAEGDGVRLVALGVALQDGSQGQTVLVRNAQSGKVVSGVVDASGDVIAARLH